MMECFHLVSGLVIVTVFVLCVPCMSCQMIRWQFYLYESRHKTKITFAHNGWGSVLSLTYPYHCNNYDNVCGLKTRLQAGR